MKRNALIFGLISGTIVSAFMACSALWMSKDPNFESNMFLGFGSMLIAFSFIFIGIKNYRDKQNGGQITFWNAFQLGIYIALIASSMYVATWLVEYYYFIPDFMDKYAALVINKAKAKGVSEAELAKQVASMENYKEIYKTPIGIILMTYVEVLPLGLLVALISAFILKRKPKEEAQTA